MGSLALDSKLSMSPLRHEAAGGTSTNPTPSEAGSSNQASTVYEEGSEMCAAAASGNIDLLREILELGAISVDQGDYDSRTALHLAASEGLLPVVVFLLEDAHAEHSPVDRWGGASPAAPRAAATRARGAPCPARACLRARPRSSHASR